MSIQVEAVEIVVDKYVEKFSENEFREFFSTYYNNHRVLPTIKQKIDNEHERRFLIKRELEREQEKQAQLLLERSNNINKQLQSQENTEASPKKKESIVINTKENFNLGETELLLKKVKAPLLFENSRPLPVTETVTRCARLSWSSCLKGGLLILAGVGVLLSILALAEVPFSVAVCKTIVNAFLHCTPEAAAWTIFTVSLILGFVACVASLIKDCLCPATVRHAFSSDSGNNAPDNGEPWSVHSDQYIQDPAYHNNQNLPTATPPKQTCQNKNNDSYKKHYSI